MQMAFASSGESQVMPLSRQGIEARRWRARAVPVQRQIELVHVYKRSGLSGPKLAAMAWLKYQTFATWRCKHGTELPLRSRLVTEGSPVKVAWLEAELSPKVSSVGRIALLLPGVVRVEITRPEQAALGAQLVKILTSLSS
jgi:hypothetical protein